MLRTIPGRGPREVPLSIQEPKRELAVRQAHETFASQWFDVCALRLPRELLANEPQSIGRLVEAIAEAHPVKRRLVLRHRRGVDARKLHCLLYASKRHTEEWLS